MKIYQEKSVNYQRIELILQAFPVGKDWQMILKGGREHIGATALANTGYKTQVIGFPDHKELMVSEELATVLAENLHCHIAFSSGIHYDDITKDEIQEVLCLARELVDQFISDMKR